jgi:hypothetical protein
MSSRYSWMVKALVVSGEYRQGFRPYLDAVRFGGQGLFSPWDADRKRLALSALFSIQTGSNHPGDQFPPPKLKGSRLVRYTTRLPCSVSVSRNQAIIWFQLRIVWDANSSMWIRPRSGSCGFDPRTGRSLPLTIFHNRFAAARAACRFSL